MPYVKKKQSISEEDLEILAKRVINNELSSRKAAKESKIGRQLIRRKIDEISDRRVIKKRGKYLNIYVHDFIG